MFKTILKMTAGVLFFGVLLGSSPVSAQITISGDIYDGNGGPLINGEVYHVAGAIRVPTNETLTVEGGAIVKFGAADFLMVDGNLVVAGSSGNPGIFTSLSDDSAGGDTNGDGASEGTPGEWTNLTFNPGSSASSVVGADIRFAGTNGFSAIQLIASDITLSDSKIQDCAGAALALNGDSRPFVSRCAFDRCTTAVTGVRMDGVPRFDDNSAQENSIGNYMQVTRGQIDSDMTVEPTNCLNGALVIATGIDVLDGVTMTIEAGVIFKFNVGNLRFAIFGTLLTNGTGQDPVVFTSITDDEHAGDTNNDGASSGTAGQWSRLLFWEDSDASVLQGTLIRYPGFAGYAGVDLFKADITMNACQVDAAYSMALFLGNNSHPTVESCAFDNSNVAITGLGWDAVPGFQCNTATGNTTGDYMLVTGGLLEGDVTVRRENFPNDVIVTTGSIVAEGGASLTFDEGVFVKVPNGSFIQCRAGSTLNFAGTPSRRVVVTCLDDDAIGGDTNKNGTATSPQPGQWAQVVYGAAASPSSVNYLTLRYAGWAGYGSFDSNSGSLIAHAIRSEYAYASGIIISNLGSDLTDCVAYQCGSNGFEGRNSSRSFVNATATLNGGVGFAKIGAYTGQVRNSITWLNQTGATSGFSAGDVLYTNGDPNFAGSDGNLNSDPLFIDPSGGDLRLQAGSPSVETGDPATTPERGDAAGYPRNLDADLNQSRRVDMGAFEFDHVTLGITGDFAIGSTISFESTGTPGTSALMFLGFGQGAFGVSLYGTVLMNLTLPFFILDWPAVPSSLSVTLPSQVAGLELVFQELSFLPGGGNLSNAVTLDMKCD